MINKIDYEISLWTNKVFHKQEKIKDLKDLIIGETYNFLYFNNIDDDDEYAADKGTWMYGYYKNCSIDGSRFMFESYTYNSKNNNYPTMRFTEEEVKKYVFIDTEIQSEEKVLILSNSNMTFEGKARNCILTTQLRNNELTFSLPYKYLDIDKHDFVINPFIEQIKEESIIKLRLEQDWYDFIVKEITETRENSVKMYHYRCSDLFIDELSRRGWELTFDEEKGMGTIDEIVPKILVGSGWNYIPVYENINETNSTDSFIETFTTIKLDDNNEVIIKDSQPVETTEVKTSPVMVWNNDLKKMLYVYNELKDGREIYSYDTLTNVDINSCQNLLMNTKNFVNSEYWSVVNSTDNTEQTISTIVSNLVLYLQFETTNFFNIKQTSGTYNKTLKAGNKYALLFSCYDQGDLSSFTAVNITITDEDYENNNISKIINLDSENIINFLNGQYYLIIEPINDLKNFTIKFHIETNGRKIINLQEIQLFECILQKDEEFSLQNGKLYSKEEFSKYFLVPGQLTLIEPYQYLTTRYFTLNDDNEPEYFLPERDENYTQKTTTKKVRTLTSSQTNRLSLLDDVAELFEGYPIFIVKHDSNGYIIHENGKAQKYITFKEVISQKNSGVCFKYGVDLTNITRTNVTDELITKLYVNNHETNGQLISISDSIHNPIKDNYVLDLGYYVKKGQINASNYYNDLYSNTRGYLNYYHNLENYNIMITDEVQKINTYLLNISNLKAQKQVLDSEIKICNETINDLNNTIAELQQQIELEQDESVTKIITTHQNKLNKYMAKKSLLEQDLKPINDTITSYESKSNISSQNLNRLQKGKKNLTNFFEKKYARFIKEGLWNDSNYLSSDTYYLDALRVMKESSKAKVSYTFDVMDLRTLPGYKGFNFKVRDKVSIEDVEFFGKNEKGVPIREEAIISEIVYNLDEPINNTITVQNFETEFENLFERIGNAITTVELNK